MGHDGHVAVACDDCRHFTVAYPQDQDTASLRGWGYCARPAAGVVPGARALSVLRGAVLDGDRNALRRNSAGLYRSDPEDGCEFFEQRARRAAAAGAGEH